MGDYVLMYHRVCDRTPEIEPWFLRGTAVTPEAFAAHLDWLVEHDLPVVPLEEVVDVPSERTRIAITFDDGYRETLTVAAKALSARGMPATCFASAAPALDGEPLWFDAWYAVIATGPAHAARGLLASWKAPLSDEGDWIRGPTRRWLAELGTGERVERLAALVAVSGGVPPAYLDLADLRAMAAAGWTIGGHGARHPRLTEVDDAELENEIERSKELLRRIGVPATVFAYPDGGHDDHVIRAVGNAGFDLACTVTRGDVAAGVDRMQIPRLFCRGEDRAPHAALEGSDERT